MLLVIHNLPSNVKYSEIKALIQSKCGLTDFVLDNLLSEGTTKRVTVGLADEGDAAFLVRKINGLYLNGQQLYVEDVRQSRASDQPYRPKPQDFNNYQPTSYQRDLPRSQSIQEPKAAYQNNSNLGYQDNPLGCQDNALGYQDNSKMMYQDSSPMNQNMAMMMNYNMAMGGMYYQPQMMPMQQPTGYLGFGDQSQQMAGMTQLTKPQQDQSLGYGAPPGEMAGGWDDNNSRRMRGMNQRSPSPPRGQRPNASRWEPPKPVPLPEVLRRSPSPPRGVWDNGASVRSFANYYEDSHRRGTIEPKSYGQQRTFRSNFADPTPTDKPAANIYGNHVMNQQKREFSRRQQWNESGSFQHKGRDNAHEPRGGNFASAKKGLKPFGRQNRDEGPKPTKKWRDETKVAPKRFAERWQNDEPPQKKFAHVKAPRHVGDITKSWREHAPRSDGAFKFENRPELVELSVTKVLNKDDTWRGQVASRLAREMAIKLKLGLSTVVMTRLKRSIRSRINLLLGSTITNERSEIELRYRAEFPSSRDSEFVQAVIETVREEQAAAAAEKHAADETHSDLDTPNNSTAPAPVKPTADMKPEVKTFKPTEQFKRPDDKLPKFPNSDKKSVHRMKVEERRNKNEITKELTPALQKTLEEEVDVLSDLFMSECMDPSNEQEKVVCEEIADVISDEFRKLIRLHMTKRLLDMNANLTVRAMSQGKVIHRDLLEAFVKDYGATALKKSEKGGKLYLVYINTYDNYDKLCALGEVIIGGFTVKFKPLHVLGAPPSAKEVRDQMMKRNNRFLKSQMDNSGENLLAPGYSITPTVDSVAAEGNSAENPETGDQCIETDEQTQETDEQTQENDEQTEKTDNQSIELEIENPETGEVNVGIGDDDQEGDVYDIEAEEEETGDWIQENGDKVQDCDVEDVYDCEPDETGGENVDEDDLEDY